MNQRRSTLSLKSIRIGLVSVACLGLWWTVGPIRTAVAEPLTVKEFNEKIEDWKKNSKDPTLVTMEVEGRVKIYTKERIRLENCKIQFSPPKNLPERTRNSMNVVVYGRMAVDPKNHEQTFQIQSIRMVPSEVEQFLNKRRTIKSNSASEWYALAAWAVARGEFYSDEKLLSYADDANRRGIEVERKSLKSTPEGLLELAEKPVVLRMPSLRQDIVHEAFHILFEQSAKGSPAEAKALAERIAEALPGAGDTNLSISSDVVSDYKRMPLETYSTVDAATRRKLHRWLYAELLMRWIMAELKKDGSNGSEIADRIVELLPERHIEAEDLRDQALQSRAAEVKTMTRSQVLDLVQQYRSRNQPQRANDVLEAWLGQRRQALESDDTEGLLSLADEYEQLLKKPDVANRILLDGWEKNPGAPDLRERLVARGFRQLDGAWVSEQDFAARPEGKLEQAIRDGLVETGMTAAQVRRSRGKPESLSRAASAGGVIEIWIYQLADGSQMLVRFAKKTRDSQLTVAAVVEGVRP